MQASWNTLYEEIQNVTFKTAKRCSGDEYIKELVDEATKYRDQAKKIINNIEGRIIL